MELVKKKGVQISSIFTRAILEKYIRKLKFLSFSYYFYCNVKTHIERTDFFIRVPHL